MTLENYLAIEFEVYPRLFRNVAVYLAQEKNLDRLLTVGTGTCPSCQKKSVKVEKVEVKSGERHQAFCSSCNSKLGCPQREPFLAYWQSQSKVKSAENNPLIDFGMLKKNMTKLSKGKSLSQRNADLLYWYASTNWLKWVWAQHRKTKDFIELSAENQHVVDAIGFCIDQLRNNAKQMLEKSGWDFYREDSLSFLAKAESGVRDERKQYYPQYQSRLSPTFRYKIKDALQI
jgi:hypothetical protein